MGIMRKLKSLRPQQAPMTSGAAKAAEGRSDLADAATKLNELRGDNVSVGGAAQAVPSGDRIANIVAAAKDVGITNMGAEAKVIGKSDSYRSSK